MSFIRQCSFAVLSAFLAFTPALAQENAAINGRVEDASGAILPGVQVTLRSTAIQGVRTATTDESGSYRFILLPPGAYSVTYELPGFKTLVRDGIGLLVGRTSTLNVALEVATLAETITVSGESPVVDVQNATVGVNFNQRLLDNLPNARDIWSVLSAMPGVQVTRFDVGGSTMGTQTGYRSYGRTGQNWITLDGVATTEGTNGAGMYYDYGSFSEITVSAAANSAEVSVPGAYVNTVMKTGGNQIKGEVYFDWEDDSFQGTNLTEQQQDQGVLVGDKFQRYNDFNFNLGGPFKKDKFWWFTSIRDQYSALQTQLKFNDGTPGASFTTRLTNQSMKLNYQLNPTNALILSAQRNTKYQPHRNGQGATAVNYIINSTQIQNSWYLTSKGQWTSVLSSRATLDVSANRYYLYDGRESHIEAVPTEDTFTREIRGGLVSPNLNERFRWQYNANLAYFQDGLAGTHDLKFGYGLINEHLDNEAYGAPSAPGTLGHVRLFYNNGRPDNFRVTDTPSSKRDSLRQHFFFLQDKWQIKRRLTLNVGLRFDRYHSYYPELRNPGTGPFSVARTYARRDIATFSDLVPRLSLIYDLFGNTKTALKASYGRFSENTGVTIATAVNPLGVVESRYNWDGTLPITPAVVARSQFVSSTGQLTPPGVDPNLKNSYTDEFTAGLEHQLFTDFAVSALFVRKYTHDTWATIDRAYSIGDYVPLGAVDPGRDGAIGTADDRRITIFERTVAGRPQDNYLTNHDQGSNWSTIEFNATKRFSSKWQMITGFDWTRTNNAQPVTTDPNRLVYGIGGQAGPAEHFNNWSYKVLGTYQLPKGISLSGNYNAQKGEAYRREAQFTASATSSNLLNPNGTFRTTNLRQGTTTLTMEPLGQYFQPNIHLVNIRAEKTFQITERQSIAGMFDLFNIINANTVIGIEALSNTVRDRKGNTVARFGRPNTILNPRIFRIGVRYKF